MNAKPIIVEQSYKTGIEKVWKALTDINLMKQWYFIIDDFELTEGATFNFYEPGEKRKFHHRCLIKKIAYMKMLQHTWTYPDYSDGESIITWELEQTGTEVRVKLTHEKVESFDDAGPDFKRENFEAGWNEILGTSLRTILEA